MRIEAIAFDLDGTLIDSAAGVAHALNHALDAAGLGIFDPGVVRSWIGDGPDALIDKALAAHGASETQRASLAAHLRAGFDTCTLNDRRAQGEAFDGVTELLAALAGHWSMSVVTNKPTPLARAVLKSAGVLDHFVSVHGADRPVQRKPSPTLIACAATQLGTRPAGLLMVGDSRHDFEAAHAAGCHFAFARWGYGHVAAHQGLQLNSPRDLITHLRPTNLQQPSPAARQPIQNH